MADGELTVLGRHIWSNNYRYDEGNFAVVQNLWGTEFWGLTIHPYRTEFPDWLARYISDNALRLAQTPFSVLVSTQTFQYHDPNSGGSTDILIRATTQRNNALQRLYDEFVEEGETSWDSKSESD